MPVPVHAARHPRRLLRDLTYETIRDAILDGTLNPGERLFEDDLAAWLGVSKTPVKEALARLSAHELVKIEANRSTRVASAGDLDLLDALELVGVLHGEAVRSLPRDGAASASLRAEGALRVRGVLRVLDEGPTCLALVRSTGAFLELARNPLVRRAAEPLHLRTAFLCRHVTIDWSRPSLVALLSDLRASLDVRDWQRTADALVRLFRRTSLVDALEVVPTTTEIVDSVIVETGARRSIPTPSRPA